ncbi:uncharacterized protein LOC143740677 [Siphateles boraxobius]|uniref:uncharacterized protein LOC143740677 n=1 Tax=Siphateles boraxobius TaxID=180520 RepID=UPI00406374E0
MENRNPKETLAVALPQTISRGRPLAKPQTSTGPSLQMALPLLGKFPPSRMLTSFSSKTESTLPKQTRGSHVEKPQASPGLPTWPSLPRPDTSKSALPLLDKFPQSRRPCTFNPSNLNRTLKTEYSGKDLELFVSNSPGYPRKEARK